MAADIGRVLASALDIYSFLLLIRIILSWIPAVRWYDAPWRQLDQITEPYLGLFRRFIPPIGGIDFSPIIAFMVLGFVRNAFAML